MAPCERSGEEEVDVPHRASKGLPRLALLLALFTETVLASRAEEVGDAAQVAVLYEARITGLPRPPTRGVDLWVLARRDGRWRIVAVVNEVLSADRPLPPGLFPSVPPQAR
jgi:hypothetical protein